MKAFIQQWKAFIERFIMTGDEAHICSLMSDKVRNRCINIYAAVYGLFALVVLVYLGYWLIKNGIVYLI